MKKKIFIIFICMLFFTTILPVTGLSNLKEQTNLEKCSIIKNDHIIDTSKITVTTSNNDDQLDQYQTKYDNYLYFVYKQESIAQSFQPKLPILTKVEILLFEWSDQDFPLTVSIRDELENEDLTSVSITPEGFLSREKWIEFDFPDIIVTPGDTYFIVCSANDGYIQGSRYNCYGWGLCKDGSSYEAGCSYMNWHGNDFIWESDERDYDCCFKTYGPREESIPSIPETPDGPEEGEINEEMTYYTKAIDSLEKQLYYQWSWGDGTTSNWLGPHDSGEIVTASHAWDVEGIYIVKVKAKNIDEIESEWSNPLIVGIPVKNDGEDQSQDTCDGHSYGVYSGYAFAQSFIPEQNTLTNAQLYIYKKGDPDTITISIRSELEEDDLVSLEKSADAFPEEKAIWVEFDFPDIEVEVGSTYYIVWTPGDVSDEDNLFYWLFGENNRYQSGCTWQGEPWEEFNPSQYEDIDFCFKTYHAKDKALNSLFLRFLENYPILYQFLQRFL